MYLDLKNKVGQLINSLHKFQETHGIKILGLEHQVMLQSKLAIATNEVKR